MFWKNERERMFCYSYNTACDKNGFVLGNYVSPGNVHDSKNFEYIFKDIKHRFDNISAISADAGYITPFVTRLLLQNNIRPILPYKRPQTKKGFYKKYEYIYDEHLNIYICPNNKELRYKTTDRHGYRHYVSSPSDCKNCENISICTHSKDNQKVLTRHIWAGYIEEANHLRQTFYNKKIYALRSQTIERVFADAKVKHGMRDTKYRGINKVRDHAMLLFACMNMKKIARWKWKIAV